MIFLVIISISPALSISCNSFPKIFGGSSSNSIIFHLDVFDDYLAFGGDTNDNYLAGFTFSGWVPYVIVTSVQSHGKYYMAKTFNKRYVSIHGVQFSRDGSLLIVHGEFNLIIVFKVSTGLMYS